jgi:hypothetical protein
MLALSPKNAAKDAPTPGKSAPENHWSPRVRLLVSVWLLLHLAAVFLPPMHFATQVGDGGSSPATDAVIGKLRWYIGPLYLDHGYFFFAPNPGPNHLVRYRVEFDDDRPAIEATFPDLKTHWPRLLYHRHFMLSEALHNSFTPPDPPPEPMFPSDELEAPSKLRQQRMREYERELVAWRFRRQQYEAMRDSFERHLAAKYGGDRVILTRIEHRLAAPLEVELERRPLNHPDSYIELREEAPPPRTERPRAGVLPRSGLPFRRPEEVRP